MHCSQDLRARQACQIHPAWLQWRRAIRSTYHKEEAIMNFDKDLDARGLNCPLPILRAKKALTDMQSGQVLRIVSTDLGSVKDFQAFCKQTGNELLSQTEASNEYTFFLKRK
jgi:tRNA 2-thiouridine synthesizing protein A